jgi:hypothetical protein
MSQYLIGAQFTYTDGGKPKLHRLEDAARGFRWGTCVTHAAVASAAVMPSAKEIELTLAYHTARVELPEFSDFKLLGEFINNDVRGRQLGILAS